MRFFELTAGLLRLSLGWVFLWAFLDKLFGWGFATAPEKAWLAGGSPTTGFLTGAVRGPFAVYYQAIAGQAWVDWLFMAGLAGIGAALLLGVLLRVSAIAGTTMMLLMYFAAWPPQQNPVIDDHIIYALLLLCLASVPAGNWLGIGRWWRNLRSVQRYRWLR